MAKISLFSGRLQNSSITSGYEDDLRFIVGSLVLKDLNFEEGKKYFVGRIKSFDRSVNLVPG